jgi:hypothetical protein
MFGDNNTSDNTTFANLRHGTNVLVRTWYKTMADHTYTVAGLTVTTLRSEHSSSRTLRGGSLSGEVMPETQASTVGIVVGLLVDASIVVERISEVISPVVEVCGTPFVEALVPGSVDMSELVVVSELSVDMGVSSDIFCDVAEPSPSVTVSEVTSDDAASEFDTVSGNPSSDTEDDCTSSTPELSAAEDPEESKDDDSGETVVVIDKPGDEEVIVPKGTVAVSVLPVVEELDEVKASTDVESADDAERVWD